jgi:hypothetical protein
VLPHVLFCSRSVDCGFNTLKRSPLFECPAQGQSQFASCLRCRRCCHLLD